MKQTLLSLICCFFLSLLVSAQDKAIRPYELVAQAKKEEAAASINLFSINHQKSKIKLDKVKTFTLFTINHQVLNTLSEQNHKLVNIHLPIEDKPSLNLELVEVFPLAPDFVIREEPSGRIVSHDKGKHYRGIVKGDPGSIVAISLINGEVSGMISCSDTPGNFILSKNQTEDSYIVYNDQQIQAFNTRSCSTPDYQVAYTKDELRGNIGASRSLSDCVRIYLEVDNDIYIEKGSKTQNVNTFVTSVFNQVSTLYAAEQINTILSEIVVWTTPSPYNATSSTGMLNAFTGYRKSFNGDLAQLLSYKASGGIAYVDGLCRQNPAFSMSYAGINNSFLEVPAYSWTVEVITHELGHLFGSQHTHACVWNNNNTAIDGCYTAEGSCSNPGLPPSNIGGTIMSYCHLTNVGIKFSNGFGTQPGNVIRSKVANAGCLTACPGGGNNGGPTCDQIKLKLEIKTDSHPMETTWEIKNTTQQTVLSGGPYFSPNTLNTIDICLPEGCYTFNIYDQFGDGICCNYGNGYYNLKKESSVLVNGSRFGSSEKKSFCISNQTATCNDGIKNGAETGIDCGGPNCPPCPTCTDGIKNGAETGIDCGGPNCPPCRIEDMLGGYYFETGWDGWTSGGADSKRIKSAYSPEAQYSIQLKGNSSESSAMTSPVYDLSSYDTIIIEFKLRAINLKTQDALSFRYFNGNSWITVSQYIFNQDFKNSLIFTKRIILTGNLHQKSQFRFQANASDKTGTIYIDAIQVTGIQTTQNATCTDGIKNGLETGIDCGGPDCPPCIIQEEQEVSIGGYYFENGWDEWSSGGANSKRLRTAYSPEGNYAIQLKGNGGDASSMISPAFDLSSYDTITVAFKLRAINLKAGDTIIFRYFNGKTWITVQQYGFKRDFANSLIFSKSFKIYGQLSDKSQFAIQSNIHDNTGTGQIYIDAITIDAFTNGAATCNDGIKNGAETGIDCGGPNCPPCNEQGVVLGGYFFEQGWDEWTGEYPGATRHQGIPAPEGEYAIQLGHPEGKPTYMQSPLYNLYPYKSLEIQFSFAAVDMTDGERFILQYFNGGRWINLTTFIKGLDFDNGKVYQGIYHLAGLLSTEAGFRIYKESASLQSTLYIDAIILKGHAKDVLIQTPMEIRFVKESQSADKADNVSIHPNPATDRITIASDVPVYRLEIYNTSGQMVMQTDVPGNGEIDIQQLNPAIYIIRIETERNIYTRKLVKQ